MDLIQWLMWSLRINLEGIITHPTIKVEEAETNLTTIRTKIKTNLLEGAEMVEETITEVEGVDLHLQTSEPLISYATTQTTLRRDVIRDLIPQSQAQLLFKTETLEMPFLEIRIPLVRCLPCCWLKKILVMAVGTLIQGPPTT